jgi:uncharacterized protein YndB with AHSA1/START domain
LAHDVPAVARPSVTTGLQGERMIETRNRPALSARPHRLRVDHSMQLTAEVLYRAWTEQFDRWFAAPGSVLMTAAVDAPFYFQTDFGGRRNAHYGRFLRLDPCRLIELSWVTGAGGTEGAETVVTVELTQLSSTTRVQLTHDGFPHEQARDAHEQAWPRVLAQMAERLSEGVRRR